LPLALGMYTRRRGCGRYPLWCLNTLTASHLLVGESHSSRSTPAVRLPWFSVTRLTARALAANERVSDRCRAFTLRQSPSCVAFAIRICVVLTCRITHGQSIDCQHVGTCEDAEPPLPMIFSMLTSSVTREDAPPRRDMHPFRVIKNSTTGLRRLHQVKVGLLSQWGKS
jgi:hypothetical protein